MKCAPTITNGTNPQPHGSVILGMDVICPRGASIPGQYEMFSHQTSLDMTSATSSRELAAGLSPCDFPDTEICVAGQDRRHASHSPLPGSSAGKTTTDTSRQSGSISSASVALQSSLASRLQTRLGTDSSTIYSMRWKNAVTPAGRQYCQLVASARRISASDCSSERSGWGTPRTFSGGNATLEAWVARNARCEEKHGRGMGMPLELQAVLTGWPTPTTRDHKDGQECRNVPTNSLLGREVWKADQPVRITASGQALTGLDAGTASSGQLNPAHSRWLMGYPPEWDACGVTAMPSSRKSQPRSSKNSSAQQPKSQTQMSAENANV